MADRPRRNVPTVNYRRLHTIGMEDDSSESEEELMYECDQDEEDHILSSPSSSEPEDEPDEAYDRDAFVGGGGIHWTSRVPREAPESWRYESRNFHDGPKGPANVPGNVNLRKVDIFNMMIKPEHIQSMCKWTNAFGDFEANKWNVQNPHREMRSWKKMIPIELRAFMGLILLAGIEKGRKQPWHELWRKDEAIRRPAFVATMSRTRFFNIMGTLRMDDTVARHASKNAATAGPSRLANEDTPLPDKFAPIRDLFESISATFEQLWTPASKLCIDEQIVKFRGNCPFRVYMPQKPGKYGIKIWAIVDAASGYILKLQVYLGQEGQTREVGQSARVVKDMVKGYEGSGRGIIADNFFTSLQLVIDLLAMKLTYCGTLRKNRTEVPLVMKGQSDPEVQNTFLFHEESMVTLVRHNPNRSRFVLLLSSAHYDDDVVTVQHKKNTVEIPAIIDYYNCSHSGVDLSDQMIGNYTGLFPTKRWPMKLLVWLMDCAGIDAFSIWIRNDPEWKSTTKSRRRLFLRDLAYELIIPQIRRRALKVNNLHKHIQSAMKIMGVDYKPNPKASGASTSRRRQPSALPNTKQGRCEYDRKCTRRVCGHCQAYICQDHWTYICPSCSEVLSRSLDDSDAEDSDSDSDGVSEDESDGETDEEY